MIEIFTGLIEEIGKVKKVKKENLAIKIEIESKKSIEKVSIGDSIAVNGICLTVTDFTDTSFTADAMYETLNRTNLQDVRPGDNVNLEKSLTLNTFLGGHIVTGDVECLGEIIAIIPKGISKYYHIKIDSNYMKYIVDKGRVTVDGASLTVVQTEKDSFSVSLIPHTLKNITLGEKKVGSFVNIETDLFAKYVEKIILSQKKDKLTFDFLRENGF